MRTIKETVIQLDEDDEIIIESQGVRVKVTGQPAPLYPLGIFTPNLEVGTGGRHYVGHTPNQSDPDDPQYSKPSISLEEHDKLKVDIPDGHSILVSNDPGRSWPNSLMVQVGKADSMIYLSESEEEIHTIGPLALFTKPSE